ncbi:endonuclease/exonuclease/phosphatase family protein [Sandaracinus amylolyticus]|uniref:endonuclease/exonuclease/phosphatase family protein n=1 Tax=Sandaracinus amylolyticus TaxID=927083 RepID=UPI001F1C92C7|nr:endonuclease/exonuclease/phosphatase family protein [Sandaracinus amylolyticus]UJR83243.1 Hypothetical protein I5071_53100 [Sandaracinus amylolyticus]
MPTANEELRLLTWNVDGLNESQLGERMERLCLEILIGGDLARAASGAPTAPMPHVLALQEVVRVAHRGYFAPHLAAAGFTIWPEAPIDREHYEVIAARAPWTIERCERRPFADSALARAGTIATLRHAPSDRRVVVITAHMESLRSGSESRLAQAREIATWMRDAPEGAIFAGDTNLRESEWDVVASELGVRDVFLELGAPKSARVTWRPENDRRAGFRFDRVWTAGAIDARSMRLRSVPRASDHAGVEVSLGV